MKLIFLGALLTLLSACGAAQNDPILSTIQGTAQRLVSPPAPKPSLEAQRAAVLRDIAAAQNSDPILLIELPKQEAVASLVNAGENRGAITWIDPSGVSVVTRGGIVISTRGLGNDLMAADVSGTQRALQGGVKTYKRLHRYLDGEAQLDRSVFACTADKAGATMTETCAGVPGRFTNTYHFRHGVLSQSKQWLGPNIGFARIEYLN
ncbi:MAG: YjbF family lipoprotein [Paracoccaceae bacterium]